MIITEVPGVKKSEIDIQVKDNAIRIAGAKSVDYTEKASLHRRERAAGRFDRASLSPFVSMPIASRRNITMASWRYTCHVPSRTSRAQSRLPERSNERRTD